MTLLSPVPTRAAKKLLHSFGMDVLRYSPAANEFIRLARYLQLHQVSLVLDVGANIGQFAEGLRAAEFPGKIVSFEPVCEAHNILAQKADAKWIVAPRAAIGAGAEQVEINVAGNSYSSSVLPMLESHSGAAPNSAYVARETVTMLSLDEAAKDFIGTRDTVFLKLDVQGFEAQVLAGAEEILSRAAGLRLEFSLLPLYEGSASAECLLERVRSLGFECWDMEGGFRDPRNYRLLQFDAVFFREGGGSRN